MAAAVPCIAGILEIVCDEILSFGTFSHGTTSRSMRLALLRHVLRQRGVAVIKGPWRMSRRNSFFSFRFARRLAEREANFFWRNCARAKDLGLHEEMLHLVRCAECRLKDSLEAQSGTVEALCIAISVGVNQHIIAEAQSKVTELDQTELNKELAQVCFDASQEECLSRDGGCRCGRLRAPLLPTCQDLIWRMNVLLAAGADPVWRSYHYVSSVPSALESASLMSITNAAVQGVLSQLLAKSSKVEDTIILRMFPKVTHQESWARSLILRSEHNLLAALRQPSDASLVSSLTCAIGVGVDHPEVRRAINVCDKMELFLCIGREVARTCCTGAFSQGDLEMLDRWLAQDADLGASSELYKVGDDDSLYRYSALDWVADSSCNTTGRHHAAQTLAKHGARISARAVSKLLLTGPTDAAEADAWRSMWQTCASAQLEKALQWQVSEDCRPPVGCLEWCTEEWRDATGLRRRYSLQEWHAWHEGQLKQSPPRLEDALHDPWVGTVVPRLLAAVAAGCRGTEVHQARAELVASEWFQLQHALWAAVFGHGVGACGSGESVREDIDLDLVQLLLEAGADPEMKDHPHTAHCCHDDYEAETLLILVRSCVARVKHCGKLAARLQSLERLLSAFSEESPRGDSSLVVSSRSLRAQALQTSAEIDVPLLDCGEEDILDALGLVWTPAT
mmetsp:Transcript_69413/g.225485  ORF Transcript_69413/g.225485 Transcript_69413/m.225485 type:complete len:679 (-) Transcript_69413:60-2096(-)